MPYKPLHPCNKPGCNVLTKNRLCAAHEAQEQARYEAERGTATERGYDGKWAKVRSMKLSTDPLCERCAGHGNVVAAHLVHHKDRNPRNNKQDNLESLCEMCHEQEHKAERWQTR